jgi:hypothetical protein
MDDAALEGSLSSLGLRDLEPIVGGWQSLAVYRARVDGRLVAVKVFDAELVDRDVLDVLLDVLSRLRRTGDVVCGPLPEPKASDGSASPTSGRSSTLWWTGNLNPPDRKG